jgi:hypothetical protein
MLTAPSYLFVDFSFTGIFFRQTKLYITTCRRRLASFVTKLNVYKSGLKLSKANTKYVASMQMVDLMSSCRKGKRCDTKYVKKVINLGYVVYDWNFPCQTLKISKVSGVDIGS